jgi:hypothetical protein
MDGIPDYTGHRRVVLNDEDKQRELLNSDELPRDAKVMALILKSMGVDEFEPKVIHQMLEFMNRTFCAFLYILPRIQEKAAFFLLFLGSDLR